MTTKTLKELRKAVNLKVIDVAYNLNVSTPTIFNWESGKTIPKVRIDKLFVLKDLYGVSWDELTESIRHTANF